MKLQISRIIMFVLIGALFLSVSSVYAETAEEYYNRGIANLDQGNYDEALSDLTKAIEINSNYAEAYYNRGTAYAEKEEYDKADADMFKARELGYDWDACTAALLDIQYLRDTSGREN